MSEGTIFKTIIDNYDPGEDWPDGRHEIITAVIGDLANRVCAAADRVGEVTIHEHGVEGGYSEFTVEWDWEFEVRVDDDVVWRTDDGFGPSDFGPSRQTYGPLPRFLEWLDRTAPAARQAIAETPTTGLARAEEDR